VDTASPDIRIHAFLDARKLSLYLDTSGDALFKRGLRKVAGEAPIREHLAAGILFLAGWKPGIPLLDPMCGSGTFLLEAAQIALSVAPGLGRGFAFEKLKNFDAKLWKQLKQAAMAGQRLAAAAGSDRNRCPPTIGHYQRRQVATGVPFRHSAQADPNGSPGARRDCP
jgi:putative N6-adenine-specific DNA methylase